MSGRLEEFVEQVNGNGHRVVISAENGEGPVAVLVSPDDLEMLEETLSIIGDPETVLGLAEGLRDIAAGNVISGEEFLRSLRQT